MFLEMFEYLEDIWKMIIMGWICNIWKVDGFIECVVDVDKKIVEGDILVVFFICFMVFMYLLVRIY